MENTISTAPFSVDWPSVILTCLVVAALLEVVAPARRSDDLMRRWSNNLSLSAITYSFNHFAVTALMLQVMRSIDQGALIDLSELPLWFALPLGVLAYELVVYALHVASHKVPLFWRFHSIHHSDPEVDISTSFRHHPLESLISVIPMLALSIYIGFPLEAALVYRVLELAQKVFTHANVKIPDSLEATVGKLIVTPRFHRGHHFADKTHTDSNYGAVFPWFDYLFNTYEKTDQAKDLSEPIGLGLSDTDSTRLDRLLLQPVLSAGSNAPRGESAGSNAPRGE